MEQTQAEHIAEDIFDDLFMSCLDNTFKELDEHFKTYSELSAAQGQICVRPGTRKNIKAFVQWPCDEIRLARDPATTALPVGQISNLICCYKLMKTFRQTQRPLQGAKPDKFKEATTKWEDWKPMGLFQVLMGFRLNTL
jgi:hypothetical protein